MTNMRSGDSDPKRLVTEAVSRSSSVVCIVGKTSCRNCATPMGASEARGVSSSTGSGPGRADRERQHLNTSASSDSNDAIRSRMPSANGVCGARSL